MRFARLYLCAVLVAALAIPTFAGGAPSTAPERVGLSSERLDRTTEQIEADIEAGRIPGAVALIARDGKIVYEVARGEADMEEDVPMKPDTIFRIYSMSKPITSAGLMMLYEEGKFRLQDPISMYMPEFKDMKVLIEKGPSEGGPTFNLPETDDEGNPVAAEEVDEEAYETVPAEREITVQDLLRHTAGFSYGFFGNTSVDKMYQASGILVMDRDLAHMCEKLGEIPLQYQPGTTWHYSVSVDVQGRLIEVLSGQPLDEFFEERIFKPLGMVDTGFYVPEEKLDRFAQMYSPTEEGGLEPARAMLSRNFVQKPGLFSGGGGLVSTAHDYMRFCQMMLNGGELDGVRLLSPKTIQLMTADHTTPIENNPRADSGYGFGLGFAVAKDLGMIGAPTSVGEFNWGGAAGTRFWIDPVEKFIGIYMVQILPHPFSYGENFKIMSYQAIVD
jgi:CubicO group peptidase (beta-lactamase class C family)